MKIKLFYLLIFFIIQVTNAQIVFEEHILESLNNYLDVETADLDNDGDLDIITAKYPSCNCVVWYENIDGLGTFSQFQIIENANGFTHIIKAADLDNDGDLDVIYLNQDSLVWNENIDGNGNFGPQQVIQQINLGTNEILIADFNGDGYLDIFGKSYDPSAGGFLISWYSNDGSGNFSPPNDLIFSPSGYPQSLSYGDMDNDDDLDIVIVLTTLNKTVWFENIDGLGNFEIKQEMSLVSSKCINIGDWDSDGDLDIIVMSINKPFWFENLDGQGTFGSAISIFQDPSASAYKSMLADIDGDLDLDLITIQNNLNNVVWYENNGLGDIVNYYYVSSNLEYAQGIDVADINNDTNMDIIIGDSDNGGLIWFENQSILDIVEVSAWQFNLYPNPGKKIVKIESNSIISEIKIYNQLRQLQFSIFNQNEINISQLQNGVYYIKIVDDAGNVSVKKIIKE